MILSGGNAVVDDVDDDDSSGSESEGLEDVDMALRDDEMYCPYCGMPGPTDKLAKHFRRCEALMRTVSEGNKEKNTGSHTLQRGTPTDNVNNSQTPLQGKSQAMGGRNTPSLIPRLKLTKRIASIQ